MCPLSPGVQPSSAVARTAARFSCASGAAARCTGLPIFRVESASIYSHAPFPCDHLLTLAVDEAGSVRDGAATRAKSHRPGFRARRVLSFLLYDRWLSFLRLGIAAYVRRGRRQFALFHGRPGPIEGTGITHIAKPVWKDLPFFEWHRPPSAVLRRHSPKTSRHLSILR